MIEQKASVDLEMKLLAGLSIEVEQVGKLYPIKLKEIAEIGESIYNQYLSALCFEIDQLAIEEEKKQELKDQNITSFLFILSQCIYDKSGSFLNLVLKSLKFFLKSEIVLSSELQGFWIGTEEDLKSYLENKEENVIQEIKVLTNENYEKFKEVLMLQSGLKTTDEIYNPSNAKAKQIIEKMQQARKELAKAKSGGDSISLSDLVSSLIVYNKNISFQDVWELSFYQFNNYFKRMQMVMDYEINLQSLLHGADSKKVELIPFISKMKN